VAAGECAGGNGSAHVAGAHDVDPHVAAFRSRGGERLRPGPVRPGGEQGVGYGKTAVPEFRPDTAGRSCIPIPRPAACMRRSPSVTRASDPVSRRAPALGLCPAVLGHGSTRRPTLSPRRPGATDSARSPRLPDQHPRRAGVEVVHMCVLVANRWQRLSTTWAVV